MANDITPLEQLKGFLNQLFQFDSQDLDFGVYKILHYKRKGIKSFIENLLVDKVKEQLQTLSEDEAGKIRAQIAALKNDSIIDGWLKADDAERITFEKFGKDKINQYLELKAKSTEAKVSVETENQIYNHLTLFFSRYYDKGDFVSKRRFGKNEKYMVPYNGEETHFYWANHDQYYIKSSETFQHYAFKIPTHTGNLTVNFKLHNAQLEQGKYVFSIIIPRIKKIAYSFDWKDGKPKDGSMNGLGVFFKYQRLEQYEEALENIAFNASEDALQKTLDFDQYIPKYFLEFETKGSQTLVNTAAMQDPWNYKLKVWDGFTYDTEQAVDLVETFNYLIGLHMQKCITKELNGKKYQFIIGNNNANKQIAVVWRSVKDWTLDDYKADSEVLKKELSACTYDLLYINDQAHIEGYQPIEEVFKNKMLS